MKMSQAEQATPIPGVPCELSAGRLALLASLAALGALATNIMLPAIPQIGRDLGVAPTELALTLTIFFAIFAIGQLLVGPLADAVGRRPFVLGGLALFAVGSVGCALAASLPVLVAGRAVQAAGACAASVLARAIARDIYSGARLTRALALVMIAMAAAPGFSPALGTAVAEIFGWRGIFVAVAITGVITAYCYNVTIGETLSSELQRSLNFSRAGRDYIDLIKDYRFITPALAVSVIVGCLYTFFGAAPAILMIAMGMSSTDLSLFFAATVFVVFGSGLIASPLAVCFGAPGVGTVGTVLVLASGLWMLVQTGAASAPSFLAAVTLFLAGMGLVNPIGTAIALEPFGDRAGAASALLGFFQMGCAALGTILIASTRFDPAHTFALVLAGAGAIAAIAFSTTFRKTGGEVREAQRG